MGARPELFTTSAATRKNTLCGMVVPHLPHMIKGMKPSHFLTVSTTMLGIKGGPGRNHLHQPTLVKVTSA